MAEGKWIAYYRVSTDKQGRSGLGLEAQAAAVESAVDRALADGLRTRDLGGEAGTDAATSAVLAHL